MTKQVFCGNVAIGGGAAISIQSMTNKDTRDVEACTEQIKDLVSAGCDIVRLSVPDQESAEAFGKIKSRVREFSEIPMVADIHFDYRLAIESIRAGADKIRINPGNIGGAEKVAAVVKAAKERNIPIRVGVNSGSLEKEILNKYNGVTAEGIVESALKNISLLESMDFGNIIVSVKSSDVKMNFDACRLLAQRTSYPLHVGVTEAGTIETGQIKSAAGIGALLLLGIGDTIRVSLTGDPVKEVLFAQKLLQCLGLRQGIQVISCPTCARTKVDLERIADEIESALREHDNSSQSITVAVMGCAVNGPGEAREADYGVACGLGKGVIFRKGEIIKTVEEKKIVSEIIELVINRKDQT